MRHRSSIVIAFFLLSLTSIAASAQTTEMWRHYCNSTTPTCMIEDGPYLWVGSDAGLVRFDRRVDTFVVYLPENSSLRNSDIMALTRDTKGRVWAATRNGGVAVYDHGSWASYTTRNSALPIDACWTIGADSTGRVWASTTSGLVKFEDGNSTLYTPSNSPLLSPWVYSVAADMSGNVWLSTRSTNGQGAELFKFDGISQWEAHSSTTDVGYNGYQAFSMLVAHDGSLWLGKEGYLCHLVGRAWTTIVAQPDYNGPMSNYVYSLAQDSTGAIWISTGYGVGKWNGSTWSTFDQFGRSNFPFQRCRGIVYDTTEFWFAGYEGGGIARWKDSAWTVYDSLSNSTIMQQDIRAMTRDSKGRYWFGARFGPNLAMYDGTTWREYNRILHGNQVMSLCADSSGNVWIGLGPMSGAGLVKFDGITPQYFDLEQLANHSNVVSALAYDKRGILWIGTQWHGNSGYPSGVLRYDGNTWTSYTSKDRTLPWGEVSSLAVEPNGDLWAGLWYKGMCHFDGTKWSFYDPSNSALPSDQIFSLALAANGDVWTATNGGAAHFNGTSWSALSASLAGLAGVGIDTYGNVWFTAFDAGQPRGGVCRYDGTSWRTFDPDNSQIGSRFIVSAMRGNDGEMWLGTADQGVVRYMPAPSTIKGSRRIVSAACSLAPIDISIDLTNPGPTPYDVRTIASEDPTVSVTSNLPLHLNVGETATLHVELTSRAPKDTSVILLINAGTPEEFCDTVDLQFQTIQALCDAQRMDSPDSMHARYGAGPVTSIAGLGAHDMVVHIASTNEDVATILRSSIVVSPQFPSWNIQSIEDEEGGYAVTLSTTDPADDPRGMPLLMFLTERFAAPEDSAYIIARYDFPTLACIASNEDSTIANGLEGCGTTTLGRQMRGESLLSAAKAVTREGAIYVELDATRVVTIQYDASDVRGVPIATGHLLAPKGHSEMLVKASANSGAYFVRFESEAHEVRTDRVVVLR